jgi:DNA modification methylase
MNTQLLQGDCRLVLPTLNAESINCIVTSPPYYGLRDYGVDGQIGLEPSPELYVAELVAVFRECWRVLTPDGTLWLNLGDSYFGSNQTGGTKSISGNGKSTPHCLKHKDLKHKDLIGIPWRVAFALQADGWYLRQDIIWHKPNPMPESVTDRCTKAHEYLFLLAKSERYFYDAAAIAEAANPDNYRANPCVRETPPGQSTQSRLSSNRGGVKYDTRNRRSVWTIPTQPCSLAHFAVMPEKLVEPCIMAGCPVGGTVLDPFGGSGTVARVAERLGRNAVSIELNPAYVEMQKARTAQVGMAI